MNVLVTRRSNLPQPDGLSRNGLRCLFVSLVVAVSVLACAALLAQGGTQAPENDSPGTDENASRRVDESEESYRARMELRDQRYREQKRADMVYSRHGGTSKLDQLPEASQEHIKRQMREMIIASRQWKPGEDVSDYPYEPSPAAQTDATLRRQEREAWAEQLERYQEREAAAYADAQRDRDGQGTAGESGQGSAAGGAAAAGSAEAGQRAAGSMRNHSDSYEGPDSETQEFSDAGVSENALSFVRGTGGQTEAAVSSADEGADHAAENTSESDSAARSGSADADALAGSLTLDELALLQGMSTPSDTLAIRDLENLDRISLQNSKQGEPGIETAGGDNPAAVQAEEPGTLAIADLEHLKGD